MTQLTLGNLSFVNKKYFTRRGIAWRMARKTAPGKVLSEKDRLWNRRHSRVRALGEHAFGVIKCRWRYNKVRYRGLAKNSAQLFSLFALANLFIVRRKLLRL